MVDRATRHGNRLEAVELVAAVDRWRPREELFLRHRRKLRECCTHGRPHSTSARVLRPGPSAPIQPPPWTPRHPCQLSSTRRHILPRAWLWNAGRRWTALTWPIATYGAPNAARSNAILVCHALTGDQYVAEQQPVDRQKWVVGQPGWAGLDDRHEPVFRSSAAMCLAAAWALPGRAARGRMRMAFGARISPPVTMRDMVRAQEMLVARLGIDRLFVGDRRVDGRDAGAGMGRDLSRKGFRGSAHRHGRLPFGPEYRVQVDSQPSGDFRRSGFRRRPLLGEWQDTGARLGGCADDGAYHLFVRRSADPANSAERPAAAARMRKRPVSLAKCSRWRAICATRAAVLSAASMRTLI